MSRLLNVCSSPWVWGSFASTVALGAWARSRKGKSIYHSDNSSLDGRVFIVTGGSSGIGLATTTTLLQRGATVVVPCRRPESVYEVIGSIADSSLDKLQSEKTLFQRVYARFSSKETKLEQEDLIRRSGIVDFKNLHTMELDLAKLESIRKFARKFKRDFKHLHVLINNAAVKNDEHNLTADGFEEHFGVNYLGHFFLTSLLLDRLKESQPSRIVNVVCKNIAKVKFGNLNSEVSFEANEAYARSKGAQAMHSIELANHLEGSGVTVNSVIPSHREVRTREIYKMYDSGFWGFRHVAQFVHTCFCDAPETAADAVIYAATDPSLNNVSGRVLTLNKSNGGEFLKEISLDVGDQFHAECKRLRIITERWLDERLKPTA